MNIIIYITSLIFAQGISFGIVGHSKTTMPGPAKMLGGLMLSVIISIILIVFDIIILHF